MSQASKREPEKQTERLSHTGTADDGPNLLSVRQDDGESQPETLARYSLQPEVQAGLTIKHFERGALIGTSLNELVKRLAEQSALSSKGDLSRAESLLTAQAHTLDAIFHDLARRAAVNAGEYLNACETYLRLAFKAQSQCRATIETLSEIKNPSHVAFVKQANITSGSQQVNNGVPARGKNQNQQNRLLEQTHGERLDFGTAGATVGANSQLEAVGAFDRAEVQSW